MKVIVDTDKIGELVYAWLSDHYSFNPMRSSAISDKVEEILIDNGEKVGDNEKNI